MEPPCRREYGCHCCSVLHEEEVFCDARLKLREVGKTDGQEIQESLGLVHVKVASTSRTYYSPLHVGGVKCEVE